MAPPQAKVKSRTKSPVVKKSLSKSSPSHRSRSRVSNGSISRTLSAHKSKSNVAVKGAKSKEKVEPVPPSPKDRDAYIDYALDIVVKSLVDKGQLNASKASLLKTEEMKSHIEKMCDSIEQKSEIRKSSRISTHVLSSESNNKKPTRSTTKINKKDEEIVRYAIKPAALPITIVKEVKVPSNSAVAKSRSGTNNNNVASSSSNIKKELKEGDKDIKINPITVQLASTTANDNVSNTKGGATNAHLTKSKKEDLLRHFKSGAAKPKSMKPSKVSSISAEQANTHAKIKSLLDKYSKAGYAENDSTEMNGSSTAMAVLSGTRYSFPKKSLDDSAPSPVEQNIHSNTIPSSYAVQAFRAKLDLKGYRNDEISLDMEGRRLVIIASRPKRDGMNARKVTEVIEIPDGVVMENLKIGRRPDGFVHIEEFVPDLDSISEK